ncbi:hypothetical protein IWQ60_004509 [Tieghemiomyces parasiticus]|uniref:Uncharacterized protein n=1 Tax=Tieghemiomyces parasiticus TaxID=78921 RepID=A0A9W8AB97_9FUNG|nr:hypothetical protein IWQ60_004509 [Tieghemiomyces parasiticus]
MADADQVSPQLVEATRLLNALLATVPDKGLRILPVQVQLTPDRWTLITRVLRDSPRAYRQTDKLRTLLGLLGFDVRNPWVQIHTLAATVPAALARGDAEYLRQAFRSLTDHRSTLRRARQQYQFTGRPVVASSASSAVVTSSPSSSPKRAKPTALTTAVNPPAPSLQPAEVLHLTCRVCLEVGQPTSPVPDPTVRLDYLGMALELAGPDEAGVVLALWRSAELAWQYSTITAKLDVDVASDDAPGIPGTTAGLKSAPAVLDELRTHHTQGFGGGRADDNSPASIPALPTAAEGYAFYETVDDYLDRDTIPGAGLPYPASWTTLTSSGGLTHTISTSAASLMTAVKAGGSGNDGSSRGRSSSTASSPSAGSKALPITSTPHVQIDARSVGPEDILLVTLRILLCATDPSETGPTTADAPGAETRRAFMRTLQRNLLGQLRELMVERVRPADTTWAALHLLNAVPAEKLPAVLGRLATPTLSSALAAAYLCSLALVMTADPSVLAISCHRDGATGSWTDPLHAALPPLPRIAFQVVQLDVATVLCLGTAVGEHICKQGEKKGVPVAAHDASRVLADQLQIFLGRARDRQSADITATFTGAVGADAGRFSSDPDYRETTLRTVFNSPTIDPDAVQLGLRMVNHLGLDRADYLRDLLTTLLLGVTNPETSPVWGSTIEPFLTTEPAAALRIYLETTVAPKVLSQKSYATQVTFYRVYRRVLCDAASDADPVAEQIDHRLPVVEILASDPALATIPLDDLLKALVADRRQVLATAEAGDNAGGSDFAWPATRQVFDQRLDFASVDALSSQADHLARLRPLPELGEAPALPDTVLGVGLAEAAAVRLAQLLPYWHVRTTLTAYLVKYDEDMSSFTDFTETCVPLFRRMAPADVIDLATTCFALKTAHLPLAYRENFIAAVRQAGPVDVASVGLTHVTAYLDFLTTVVGLRDPLTMSRLDAAWLLPWYNGYGAAYVDCRLRLMTMAREDTPVYLVFRIAQALEAYWKITEGGPADRPTDGVDLEADVFTRPLVDFIEKPRQPAAFTKDAEEATVTDLLAATELLTRPVELCDMQFGDPGLETALQAYRTYALALLNQYLTDDRLGANSQLVILNTLRQIAPETAVTAGESHETSGDAANVGVELATLKLRLLIKAQWDQEVTHSEATNPENSLAAFRRLVDLMYATDPLQQPGHWSSLLSVLDLWCDQYHSPPVEAVGQATGPRQPPARLVLSEQWATQWSAAVQKLVSLGHLEYAANVWLLCIDRYILPEATEVEFLGRYTGAEGPEAILPLLAGHAAHWEVALNGVLEDWDKLSASHQKVAALVLTVRGAADRLVGRYKALNEQMLTAMGHLPADHYLAVGRRSPMPNGNIRSVDTMVFPVAVYEAIPHLVVLLGLQSLQRSTPTRFAHLLATYLRLPTALRTGQLDSMALFRGLARNLTTEVIEPVLACTVGSFREAVFGQIAAPSMELFRALLVLVLGRSDVAQLRP